MWPHAFKFVYPGRGWRLVGHRAVVHRLVAEQPAGLETELVQARAPSNGLDCTADYTAISLDLVAS